jgi:DNA-binding response OmpR family regulator
LIGAKYLLSLSYGSFYNGKGFQSKCIQVIPMIVLVIEDEFSIFQVIKPYLENDGHTVLWADDGVKGLEIFHRARPEFIILDLMLPSMDGIDVCNEIRKESDVPIIMLTAKGNVEDRISGLASGADDYIAKPFSPRELVARIKTIMRRYSKSITEELVSGLCVNDASRAVTLEGITLELTVSEYEIVRTLYHHPEKVFTREELINIVKGSDSYIIDRGIDVHIANLRKKLGCDSRNPKYIKTVWGVGYKL